MLRSGKALALRRHGNIGLGQREHDPSWQLDWTVEDEVQ
jgi:hypothetical protein